MGKRKKWMAAVLGLACAAGMLAGCAGEGKTAESTAAGQTAQESGTGQQQTTQQSTQAQQQTEPQTAVNVRIGSLKGATSIGLVQMMDKSDKGEAEGSYTFTMAVQADELLTMMIKGDLDMALIPANVASILNQKTEGGIRVIDVNTLGVLYMVSGDSTVKEPADLKGKTVYLNGKGTTPDYVLRYLLGANGLTEADVKLEYKSEATEIAALLTQEPSAIGLLPQPFATVACAGNETLSQVMDMNAEWDKTGNGSSLVTGVTVVRKEFLEQNEAAVQTFLKEHGESAAYTAQNPEETAQLVAAAGIVAKAELAEKAIPACNITCLTGQEMKQALEGYLQVLYDQDAASVGGRLPETDFYYIP